MIRTIIIDDEQACIDRLRELLTHFHAGSVDVVGTSRTVKEGIEAITKLQPDAVFLDVQIGEKTGFDLLQQLSAIPFDVVFTTAYEKYAVQAFKVCAIDYLLKPVDADDLQEAMGKLQAKRSREDVARKLDTLFHNLKTLEAPSKRICVPTMAGFVYVQVSDIVRCEADGNYTTLFLKDSKRLIVAKTLKEFEEILGEYDFFRVHNSHLVNLAYVKEYSKGKGGSVRLTDNSQIEVSERRKGEFLKRLTGNGAG
jgi:two-component system LytT family response regulator